MPLGVSYPFDCNFDYFLFIVVKISFKQRECSLVNGLQKKTIHYLSFRTMGKMWVSTVLFTHSFEIILIIFWISFIH